MTTVKQLLDRTSPGHWLLHVLGLALARTQTTPAERVALTRHAAGRRSIVEIGVWEGANTANMRRVMDPVGTITGVDPHRPGRLGVNFDLWVARREADRHARGQCVFLRELSEEVVSNWTAPIDFLFIDGDHSWKGIDHDWREWTPYVVAGGKVALHDSRSVPGKPDLDVVRYTREVILADPRFRVVEEVDSLTVLERLRED